MKLSIDTGLEVVELGVGSPDSSISPDVGLDVGMPVILLPDVGLDVGMPVTLLTDVGSEVTVNVGEGDDVSSAEVGD